MSDPRRYRLVTRADFDGLVCAVLLKELELIDEIVFVHPKDMQDGKVEITDRDITTNVPFVPSCYLAFDHHSSEAIRHGYNKPGNLILDPEADSAARVVYKYYGGRERFPRVAPDLMAAVDKADAGRFTEEEVFNPTGWVLLNFIMDPRTGLGRFRNFSNSNHNLLMRLIDYCREHPVDEILARPDVTERVKLYFDHTSKAREQIRRCATVHGSLVVLDMREEDPIWVSNRFLVYALFPKCSISVHALWGVQKKNTVFAVGHSIFNRTSPINVGEILMGYGGGGHAAAGTAQVENDDAEGVLRELILKITAADCAPMIETSAVSPPPPRRGEAPADRANGGLSRQILDALGRVATRQDLRQIQQRLERIEKRLAEMTAEPVNR